MARTLTVEQPLYTSTFALLCLSQALFSASFNMIIPELPSYLSAMGGEDYKGFIIGLFTLTAGLSRPFSGKLTDTIGRMPVQVIGTLVCVVASLIYPFATTVFGFLLLRFFHGFSTGFKPTATAAYLADIVPVNRRGEGMGILGISMQVGASIAPPFGSWVAQVYSMNWMFYISSALALFSVIILLGMKETLDNKQTFSVDLLKITRNDIFDYSAIPPAVIALIIYMGIGALVTIGPDQTVYLGMTNKGFFFTSFTACSILSRLVSGKVSDRYGRVPVIRASLVMLMFALTLFNWADSAFMLLAASGALGFALGIASPATFAWTIDRCKDETRGKAMATLYIALEVSIGCGALFSAWVYNNDPTNFGKVFLIMAGLTSLGLVYLWRRVD